ncbi:MAG: hypothetical protein ABW203_04515 [Novosphingobium sp.]
MNRRFALVALPLVLLAGCGKDKAPEATTAEVAVPAATGAPAAAGGAVALGLTEPQLLDAKLTDASGKAIGEIDGVVRGADGQVSQLMVDVEDSSPDRHVHVPLTGLQAVPEGTGFSINSTLSHAALMKLPAVTM